MLYIRETKEGGASLNHPAFKKEKIMSAKIHSLPLRQTTRYSICGKQPAFFNLLLKLTAMP